MLGEMILPTHNAYLCSLNALNVVKTTHNLVYLSKFQWFSIINVIKLNVFCTVKKKAKLHVYGSSCLYITVHQCVVVAGLLGLTHGDQGRTTISYPLITGMVYWRWLG